MQAGVQATYQPLNSNAVGPDGKILLNVAVPTNWFWPAGVLDPKTGHVDILNVGYDADMWALAWTPDGKIVVTAMPLRASLWRWTPSK